MSQQVEHPYLQLKIDGVDITQMPDYVIDMKYERYTEGVGEATFTVYDEQAMQVEAMLVEGADNVEFSYGMYPQTAKTYVGSVYDWDIELAGWGAILTIKMITKGLKKNSGGQRKDYQGSPDEVVSAVAGEEGWNLGIIEPSQSIPFKDPATGSLQYQIFIRDGLDAFTFLEQKVKPYAVSKGTGKSGYFLYLTDQNGTTVNFHTKDYTTNAKIHRLTFVVGSQESDVVSWNPGYSGALFLSCKGMILEYQDETGTLQKIIKGDASEPERKIIKVRSQDEARVLADYMWELKLRSAYKASMQVINHEGIKQFDKIAVLCLTKNNVPHHSSGMYLVTAVTDSISGGQLITDLELLGGQA